jgi:hypothetical protein
MPSHPSSIAANALLVLRGEAERHRLARLLTALGWTTFEAPDAISALHYSDPSRNERGRDASLDLVIAGDDLTPIQGQTLLEILRPMHPRAVLVLLADASHHDTARGSFSGPRDGRPWHTARRPVDLDEWIEFIRSHETNPLPAIPAPTHP